MVPGETVLHKTTDDGPVRARGMTESVHTVTARQCVPLPCDRAETVPCAPAVPRPGATPYSWVARRVTRPADEEPGGVGCGGGTQLSASGPFRCAGNW